MISMASHHGCLRRYHLFDSELREMRRREVWELAEVTGSVPTCRTSETPPFCGLLLLQHPLEGASPVPLSLFPAGTAGIYQGANGLTGAAGFGSVHQVDPPLPPRFSPSRASQTRAPGTPPPAHDPHRKSSLLSPALGCHRGECVSGPWKDTVSRQSEQNSQKVSKMPEAMLA